MEETLNRYKGSGFQNHLKKERNSNSNCLYRFFKSFFFNVNKKTQNVDNTKTFIMY